MQKINKLQIFLLQTQQIRENLAAQLQNWITRVEREIEKAEEPAVRAEWTRLAGFLSQVLNSVMRAYDQVRLDEDIQKAREILDQLERLREKLDEREKELIEWERRLQVKEEELNRREQALKAKE